MTETTQSPIDAIDEDPFEPLEPSDVLQDGNAVLLKASEAEPYLLKAYDALGVPEDIVQKFLRSVVLDPPCFCSHFVI